MLGKPSNEQTPFARWACVPWYVRRWLVSSVQLYGLRRRSGCVLRTRRIVLLRLSVFLLLSDKLPFLLCFRAIRGKGISVYVMSRLRHKGVEHAVFLGKVRRFASLSRNWVVQTREATVRAYYLGCRSKRVPNQLYLSTIVYGARCFYPSTLEWRRRRITTCRSGFRKVGRFAGPARLFGVICSGLS